MLQLFQIFFHYIIIFKHSGMWRKNKFFVIES